jgi:hypothetical protein
VAVVGAERSLEAKLACSRRGVTKTVGFAWSFQTIWLSCVKLSPAICNVTLVATRAVPGVTELICGPVLSGAILQPIIQEQAINTNKTETEIFGEPILALQGILLALVAE